MAGWPLGKGAGQTAWRTTIRLVFVPMRLFDTPQMLAVFVNCCELISTHLGRRPASMAAGTTNSSSLTRPPPNFTDLERDMPAGFQYASEFGKHGAHRPLPLFDSFQDGQVNGIRIDGTEPAS